LLRREPDCYTWSSANADNVQTQAPLRRDAKRIHRESMEPQNRLAVTVAAYAMDAERSQSSQVLNRL